MSKERLRDQHGLHDADIASRFSAGCVSEKLVD
jgi:hypothetical protein